MFSLFVEIKVSNYHVIWQSLFGINIYGYLKRGVIMHALFLSIFIMKIEFYELQLRFNFY